MAGRAVAMLSLQETRGSGTDPLGRHFEEPGALASGAFEWAVLRGQTDKNSLFVSPYLRAGREHGANGAILPSGKLCLAKGLDGNPVARLDH